MDATCDSCGFDAVEVWAVHRVYVTPEAWDTPGSVKVLEDVEQWCFACLSHYPHQLVEPARALSAARRGGPPAGGGATSTPGTPPPGRP